MRGFDSHLVLVAIFEGCVDGWSVCLPRLGAGHKTFVSIRRSYSPILFQHGFSPNPERRG